MLHSLCWLVLAFIFSSLAQANAQSNDKQYPEDREYTSRDRGFRQYGAPSLHGTSTYALTYDDGPHETLTPQLLDVLKEFDVRATFFIITSRINAKTRPILRRMLAEGHILAPHGEEHHNSNQITEAQFKDNLRTSILKLKAFYDEAGLPMRELYYRYPYAAYGARSDYHHMNALQSLSQELFGDNCLQFAFWDVDTVDWLAGMTPEDILQNLRAHEEGGAYWDFEAIRDAQGRTSYRKVQRELTHPPRGGVVLMHDIHPRTLAGTRLFLQHARDAGLALTTLPEIDEFRVLRECRFR